MAENGDSGVQPAQDDPETLNKSTPGFPVALNLPAASAVLASAAGRAVKEEARNASQYKKLRCCATKVVGERLGANIVALDIGQAIDFDWTWEGAVAFRPADIDRFETGAGEADEPDESATLARAAETPAAYGASSEFSQPSAPAWMGEVVEVDEAQGRIFVSVPGAATQPFAGSFYVRPYDFLFYLSSLYDRAAELGIQQALCERLAASCGGIHPEPPVAPSAADEALGRHTWSVLWGPPGTGKTYSVGREVAAALQDPGERILVVSTTNRATDAAAISIGTAAQTRCPEELTRQSIRRIGKTVDYDHYAGVGLGGLLAGAEPDQLREQTSMLRRLERTTAPAKRAELRQQLQELRRKIEDHATHLFLDPEIRVVVATSFKAMSLLISREVLELVSKGVAPFTTIIIDEAGLISRAATAALSLLASRRVRLVGDSKQLAPISTIARILPTNQATWLAQSGLSHLQRATETPAGVKLLRVQHRMHPDVARAISKYQYDNRLDNAPEVASRSAALPAGLQDGPRTRWYVLDEETTDLPRTRAERGPGNRSWVRSVTADIIERLMSDAGVRRARGLFITPFRAQARAVAALLAKFDAPAWASSTVHSQQGAEADIVLFDTVNAGSFAWPHDEWKRLINVALSRAREAVIVLASRAEMEEPYLRPLLPHLQPCVLRQKGAALLWENVPAGGAYCEAAVVSAHPESLGAQLQSRKTLRPVLSVEQQRLCGYEMDGKPRLVRGVAGSGKTIVLAHWLQKTVQRLGDRPDAQIWAVYANRSLHGLIYNTIDEAWRNQAREDAPGDDLFTGNAKRASDAFPWDQVKLMHVRDIIAAYQRKIGEEPDPDDFDYDGAAARILARLDASQLEPCCQALFIDEAQDMGPHTLQLLSALVERSDPADPKSRAVNIFYDNAQNIYGRKTPVWSDFGLDLRGRSTVMKESFRATRPITEYALNVLYRLKSPIFDPDHKEIVERGLVERIPLAGHDWWRVHFTQVEGPPPALHIYRQPREEFEAMARQLVRLIGDEKIRPADIRIIFNGKHVAEALRQYIEPVLQPLNAGLAVRTGQSFTSDDSTIIATTAHSFKGYEAEVVFVAAADQFVGAGQILPNQLYVAMTRARSILTVFGARNPAHESGARILDALEHCLKLLHERPAVELPSGTQKFQMLLERLGPQYAAWLQELARRHTLIQEPLTAPDGEILAQPLFWFETPAGKVCCFGHKPVGSLDRARLEDFGIEIIRPKPL